MTAMDQALIRAYTDPAQPKFQPAYQVDSFAWPSGCTRLSMVAGDQVERLADALVAGLEQGQQVLAMSGCRRGDGCTTLLLCAARRLADRGLRIAILDGDFDNPLLARRLGLLPEAGWEEVLAARLPAGEVTIESVQDRLAVLPLCGELSSQGGPDRVAGLDVLRKNYDLVLVDLGEFDEGIGDGPTQTMVGWIDAVVLVHNIRSTSNEELSRTRRRATEAGFVEAGIVENFAEARRSA